MPRQPTARASGRPPSVSSKLSKAMRAEFDQLLSENLPAVFGVVVEAAIVDKDMAAADLLLARESRSAAARSSTSAYVH